MKTIFDFGMYDASDTLYYLEAGFRVVAVEANPSLLERARSALAPYIASEQLHLIGGAISNDHTDVELTVCGEDSGSSSIYAVRVNGRNPVGTYTVPGITTLDLIEQFGTPYYLKIDLEGADRLAVLSLSARTKPEYLSFEANEDTEELVEHAATIGFTKFKLIHQCSFREISNQNNLADRAARKLVRLLGFAEPQYVRRGGRLFKVAHSSGPAPWCSDGAWCSRDAILARWRRAKSAPMGNAWYDLQAS